MNQPFRLGGHTLPNRLALAPMTTYSSLPSGEIAPDELSYLERRAAGGLGAVITAACCVHPSGWAFPGQWQCSDDRFIPSLEQAAESIHRGGAKAILQIHHGGRQCPPDLCGGECVSASAIPLSREGAPIPRALTEPEILEIIDAFGQATRRAAEAGFDGVEIHGANTYLLQQFVSPHSNRREDAWGQDRLKFSKGVVEAVLANAPEGFIVGYRFSPEEPDTPGLRMADTEALIEALVATKIDYLHISLRDYRQGSLHNEFEGPTLDHVAKVIAGRKAFMGVGSVKTREDAENVLAAGADLVALGRIEISDPEWPRHPDSPNTKVPYGDFAKTLTLPTELANRIDAAKGWFERG